MAEHMKTTLVDDALIMAIWKRKSAKDLLWHTDQGRQYASDSHRKLLKQHSIRQSMSRKANCWDNVVSESIFHTLKTECVNHENYATREAARKFIFDYIEVFYNRQRIHSNNGYLTMAICRL
jgi:putative transposase